MVPEAAELVRPHLDLSTVPLAHFATDNTKALNQKQDRDRRPNMLDMDVRLADMDAAGIDKQVIMPPPPQCTYTVPADIGLQAMRIINKGLAEFAAKRPDRFAALGTVPMQDGEMAAAELERGMKEHGLKGVQILTNVAGKELSDPMFAAVLGQGGGARRRGADPSQRLHRSAAAQPVLFQQRHRQSVRYLGRAALPDFRRRARAASRT